MSLPEADEFFWGFFIVVLVAALLTGLVSLVNTARVDGAVDFCAIENTQTMPPAYRLWAHRPWRTDLVVSVSPTLAEAQAAANSLGCKLWRP